MLVSFFLSNVNWSCPSYAQTDFILPQPGQMIPLSENFNPVTMRGIRIDPANPFRFNFLVDEGDTKLNEQDFKDEAQKVIKYFLTSLTVPDDDLWVNLSPYEKDRLIPQEFGKTEMGRDLLAQDYILKQITASLIYPEKELGKKFWDRVYKLAQEKYGSTDIPINTFNKVWIVPDQATVYERQGTAFVSSYHLKVMLEEDYLALDKNKIDQSDADKKAVNSLSSQVIRSIVLPELEKEVNSGKNFSSLRQIFYSLVLATWYKTKLKQAFLNQAFAGKNKVSGVLVDDEEVKEKIYQQYLEAFKKGVYNYIKEDYDPKTQETIPRKYFSGGVVGHIAAKNINFRDLAQLSQQPNALDKLRLRNISGDMGLINQNIKQEDDVPSGLMGRWEFQGISYLNSNGLLKLLLPKRIPNKNGSIEDEFKEPVNEITLKTVSLDNKNLNGREGIGSVKIKEIKTLLKEMGLEGIKFRVISRDHKSSVKYRIYGVGYKQAGIPIIAIREDILTRGNIEQIREALEHEKSELEGQGHKEIRVQQTDRGLRNLIRSLSNEDKVDISFYNHESSYRDNLDLLMTVLTDPKAQFFNRNSAAEILKERDYSREEYERILQGLIGAINDETLEGYTKRDVLEILTKAAGRVGKDSTEQKIKPTFFNLLRSKDSSTALAAFEEIKKLDPRFENVIPLDITFKYEIDSWNARAESKNIKVISELPEGNLFIEQQRTFGADLKGGVIQELIVNALKYTPEGGTVTIVLKQDRDHVVFSVKDTGIGIPDVDKEKVWRQGYRSPNAQAADEGTGLGLPIMRSTVLSYGGSINFESEEGKGTTFTVRIPRGDVPDFAMQASNKTEMIWGGAGTRSSLRYSSSENSKKTKKDSAMISAEAFVKNFVGDVVSKHEEWEAWQFYEATAKALSRINVFMSYSDSKEDEYERGDLPQEERKETEEPGFDLADFLRALYKENHRLAAVLFAGFDDYFFKDHERLGEYYMIGGEFLSVEPEIVADILKINEQFQKEAQTIERTPQFEERWRPAPRDWDAPRTESLIKDHRRIYVTDREKKVSFLINKEAMPLVTHLALIGNHAFRKEEGGGVLWITKVLSALPKDLATDLIAQYIPFLYKNSRVENNNRTFGQTLMGQGGESEEDLHRELTIIIEAARDLVKEGKADPERAPLLKDMVTLSSPNPPAYWHPQWEVPTGERLEKIRLFILRLKQAKYALSNQEPYTNLSDDKKAAAIQLDHKFTESAYYGFQALYGHEMTSCWSHFLDLIYLDPETASLVIRGAPRAGHANVVSMFEIIMDQRVEGRTRLARFIFDIVPNWSVFSDEEFLAFYQKSNNPYDTTYLMTYFAGKIPHLVSLITKEDFVKVTLCARRLAMATADRFVGSTIADFVRKRPELLESLSGNDKTWLSGFLGNTRETLQASIPQEVTFKDAVHKAQEGVSNFSHSLLTESHILHVDRDRSKLYSSDVLKDLLALQENGDISNALSKWALFSEMLLSDMVKYEERIRGKEAFVLEEGIKQAREGIAILDEAFKRAIAETSELKIGTSARTGISVGEIHVVEDTDDMHELVKRIGLVGRDQIAVARRFPTEYEQPNPNRGIVSGVSESLGSPDHSSVLAARWLLPHTILPRADVFLKPWNGTKVLFAVGAEGTILRRVSDEEYARLSNKIESMMKSVKIEIPEANLGDTRRIVSLDEIRGNDRNVFGAKTARLGELRHNGVRNIPDGLGIPFGFYKAMLDHNPLIQGKIEGLLTTGREKIGEHERFLADIRHSISSPLAMPPELRQELVDQIQRKFGDNPVLFVRSSSNCEDLKNFSGAGLHDSYEFIVGIDAIIQHVQNVWASLWNLRAFEERERWNMDHRKAAMGVLLEEGKEASKSFVAFTHEPQTGKDDGNIYFWASYGLGRTLVDKKQYPGEGALWVYDRKTGTVKNKSWTSKSEYAVAERNNWGGRLYINVRSRRSSFKSADEYKVLSEAEAIEVANQTLEIEKILGPGQDIEGGFVGEDTTKNLFTVQSRDIPPKIDVSAWLDSILQSSGKDEAMLTLSNGKTIDDILNDIKTPGKETDDDPRKWKPESLEEQKYFEAAADMSEEDIGNELRKLISPDESGHKPIIESLGFLLKDFNGSGRELLQIFVDRFNDKIEAIHHFRSPVARIKTILGAIAMERLNKERKTQYEVFLNGSRRYKAFIHELTMRMDRAMNSAPEDNLRRDGTLLSKEGTAPNEFSNNLGALKPAELLRVNEAIQFLMPRIQKLEEQKPENKWEEESLPKIVSAIKLGMERLVKAHEQKDILSRPIIVHGKENFAAGLRSGEQLIIADELHKLSVPLMAEYLLYLSVDFGRDNWIWWRGRDSLFEENKAEKQRLDDVVKQIVHAKAVIHNGVDYHAAISQVIESLPGTHPEPVFTDESDYPVNGRGYSSGSSNIQQKFNEMIRKDNQFLLYGQWESVARLGSTFGETEQKLREKKHIKVALNNQGVAGVWDVPQGVNEIIKKAFLASGIAGTILADITPLTLVIDFYRLKYPFADEILTNYINGLITETTQPFLSYDMFKAILNSLMQRHNEVEEQVEVLRKKDDSGYHSIEDKNRRTEEIVAKMLDLIPPQVLKDNLREYFIDNNSNSKSVRETIRTMLHDRNEERKSKDMLWDIYLEYENTVADDTRFAEALIDQISWDSDQALWKIYHTLSEGNIQRSNKVMRVFWGLDINREKQDMLYRLVGINSPYREMIATYTLAHVKLFGVETETTRGIGRDDELTELISNETRNIYYHLMNIDSVVQQGGVANRYVDNRIFGYAKALDHYGAFPGEKGHTWFLTLREHIHRSVDDSYLHFIKAILKFWMNLDSEIFTQVSREQRASWGIFDSIAEDHNKDQYSKVLNNVLNMLIRNNEIKADKDALEQVVNLDEEHVIEVLKESNLEVQDYYVEQVEFMLRLYFALSEKFTMSLPRSIQTVKQAGIHDEFKDHGRGDYLDFARNEYTILTEALNGADDHKTFIALVNLRLAIKNYFLSHSVTEAGVARDQRDDGLFRRKRLSELDHNLHLLGRNFLSSAFNQYLQSASTEEIQSNIKFLISFAKFIQTEGLGGVDFGQYINELENGRLTYSQLYDVVRALQGEVLKAIGQLNKNVRFVVPHILSGDRVPALDARWAGLLKFDKIPTEHGWDQEIPTAESKKEIENALIDDLVRESGLDVFKDALTKFESRLFGQVAQRGNEFITVKIGEQVSLDENIVRFDQTIPSNKTSLGAWGKKGLNLSHMKKQNVPVPPGFIISSQLANHPDVVSLESFKKKITEELQQLRQSSGDNQLLVFARSGSAFMLPGLLMTIPNIGMNDRVVEEMAKNTGDAWFAYDAYASFIRSFGVHVLGIDEKHFNEVLNIYTKDKLSSSEMKQAVEGYKGIVRQFGNGRLIPEDMVSQIVMATEAIYASWNSPNAREYRHKHGLSDKWGTPVIIQKAVFGNRSGLENQQRISGAGSATLMSDLMGRPRLQGELRPRGQGDLIMSEADTNVIAMSKTDSTTGQKSLEEINPDLYQKLLKEALRLKDIFGYEQLFEFAIEQGEVWITQSNDDFDNDDSPQFADSNQQSITRGKGLSGGAIRGWVANSIPKAEELVDKYRRLSFEKSDEVKNIDGVILLLDRVSPEIMNRIPQGVHILAKKLSVHAVSLAQGQGITVVAEVPDEQMAFNEGSKTWMIAGQQLVDGTVISMDGHRNPMAHQNSGNIYLGSISLKTDKAQLSNDKALISNTGGIDLTSKRYKISINSDGQEVKMDFDSAMIQNLQFNGVEFKINRIDPVVNPQTFLLGSSNN